jgi:hypothetical protein
VREAKLPTIPQWQAALDRAGVGIVLEDVGDLVRAIHLPDSFYALLGLILRLVHDRADGIRLQIAAPVRPQHLFQLAPVLELRVQPEVVLVWRDDHGHAVVDRLQ